ncbi:hypothetical protein G3M48_001574 [Beauveria asiatica]|uniref:Uncharacterized protein n=1 Tax=Beauveria asiatica TaxID=1069075 RepID=A0AAW0RFC0_9HYPO
MHPSARLQPVIESNAELQTWSGDACTHTQGVIRLRTTARARPCAEPTINEVKARLSGNLETAPSYTESRSYYHKGQGSSMEARPEDAEGQSPPKGIADTGYWDAAGCRHDGAAARARMEKAARDYKDAQGGFFAFWTRLRLRYTSRRYKPMARQRSV